MVLCGANPDGEVISVIYYFLVKEVVLLVQNPVLFINFFAVTF